MNKQPKEYFPLIDLFRIFMCAMVLFFHAILHKIWVIPKGTFLHGNLSTGAIYMDAFFLLSGFLLYYLHKDKILNLTQSTLKEFYAKRLIRIYPQYIAYTLTIIFYSKYFVLAIIPAEILCIHSFFPALFKYAGNGGTWFISCLLFAYLLFPILAKIVNATKKNVYVIVLLYLLIVYCSILIAKYKFGGLFYNPMYRLPIFLIGMYLAKIYITKEKLKNCFAILASIVCFALLFALIPILYKNNFFFHVKFGHYNTFYSCITIPLFSAIIYSLASIKGDFCKKLNNSKILKTLSNITFPFYIWQGFALRLTKDYFLTSQCNHLLILFLINFLVASVAYIVFDKLIAKFLTNIYKRNQERERERIELIFNYSFAI